MLSDRELNTDAIKDCGGVKVIERADAPTAKQVAVIWVSEDGFAPEVHGTLVLFHLHFNHFTFSFTYSGFWVCNKAGKMRELKSGMPQLDPCCFSLLHPRGTPGWRFFMKKKDFCGGLSEEEKRMQDALDAANNQEIEELVDGLDFQNDGDTDPDAGVDELDEEENGLDADVEDDDVGGSDQNAGDTDPDAGAEEIDKTENDVDAAAEHDDADCGSVDGTEQPLDNENLVLSRIIFLLFYI